MEAAFSPLSNSFPAVHGGLPPDFQTLHEGFEEFEVDDIIFDNEDVDRWDSSVKKASWELWRVGFGFVGNLMNGFRSGRGGS